MYDGFFFQAEDGIRDLVRSRGLGDVYKRQLVLGPWVQSTWFTVPGILLHLSATGWLLLNVITPLKGERRAWGPGLWHLLTSYVWIVAPVLVAPLIILKVPGFPGAGIEQNAPQALIYGWGLQFAYALLPYIFPRFFLPNEPAKLGGTWFTSPF